MKKLNYYKRRLFQKIVSPLAEIRLSFIKSQSSYKKGSANWLAATEKKYGGFHNDISVNKISSKDNRKKDEIKFQKMTGGDKMFHMGYSRYYEKFLESFLKKNSSELNIAEFGILKGTGLALLSDLFPKSNLYGFDIDLSNFIKNKNKLIDLGAFIYSSPKIFECDQYKINEQFIAKILGDKKLDIVIDDGLHQIETIKNTAMAIKPFMKKNSVIFVEDNSFVTPILQGIFEDSIVHDCGALKVVCINSL
ncbi:hypothetical protein [Prochlorococcus marinus]|uniref:hypothetical protein n=1 Tax=Prochlorococcus marinus TaxID=1219 RepID=UPI001ADBAFF8|nr:hypothetical protein [Prochlorococcus marinus]MBO8204959.1 hypothetical protein [Prochlorococcus marinus CUG1415]MBW3044231.1 hypothetical protein [Prochlorococcus marinus str. MU1415]